MGADLRQQQTSFYDGSANERTYSFIGRFQTRLTYALTFHTEAGAYLDRDIGTTDYSRNIYSAEAYADYHIGKLSTHLAYEYQLIDNITDKSDRSYIELSLERSF